MTTRARAKPATPERYLWTKPGARHLWFRMAVPRRYKAIEGRCIVQRCLGTSDRRQASLLAAKLRTELHDEWEARLTGGDEPSRTSGVSSVNLSKPTDSELRTAAVYEGYLHFPFPLEHMLRQNSFKDNEDYAQVLKGLRASYLRLVRTRHSETRDLWEGHATYIAKTSNWMLDPESDSFSSFVEMLTEAGLEAYRVQLERAEGNLGAQPTSSLVRDGLRARAEAAAPGPTVAELFERYAAQRLAEGRKRADTVVQDRKVVLAFSEFVGKDRSAGSITREEVRAWRNTIAVLPPGFRKAKAYTGLCLKEAAAKAAEVGAKGLSATTISKYVSTISPFFNWCVAEGYTSANPCDGLHYKPEKGRNRRPPFTDEQLRAILTSPLFTGFLRDGKEHQPGDRLASDWRCWIPLCCMFTGARIGEIAQLRVEDVREEHGVWLLHLRHEPTKGQRTKSGKSRAVPIHSQLRGLGFLEFVETQRQRASASGNPQLFPELRPNEREQIGARPSRFWRDYLKRTGIKGGRDGFGAHSFRHTLADKFRAAGYLDNQIGIIFGHDQRSTTAGYGTLPQGTVHMLTEIIESFAISCINTIGTTE